MKLAVTHVEYRAGQSVGRASAERPLHRVLLQLRGYPAVAVDGRAVDLRLKRGLALLLLLIETPRKSARGHLAETLWPGAPVDVGRTRLRRLCHETNGALGVALVVGDNETLWLDGTLAGIESDVAQVRAAARALLASPEAADAQRPLETLLVNDTHGAHEVAAGFGLDSDLFNAWLDERRAEQRNLVCRALAAAGESLCCAAQPALAAQAASRLIGLDPLSDAGHRVLIEARAAMGDGAGVEAAYFACAELMRSEFGMPPSSRVEAAYAAAQATLQASAVQAPPRDDRLPPIRFAETDDGSVAYLELGNLGKGETTLIILFGLWSHVEVAWEEPRIRAILQRLAMQYRVVLMDRRGTGLSERLGVQQTVDSGAQDLEAVRQAIGAPRVWLLGNSVGGTVAIEYAHRHPQHVHGLLLCGAVARGSWAADYPWALTSQQHELWLDQLRTSWGQATSWKQFAPSMASDPAAREWWARMLRQSLSRNSMPLVVRAFAQMDVRDRLSGLAMPTLIVQREGDLVVRTGAARHLAEHIPGAELILLPGADHLLWCGDTDAVLEPMERFIATRTTPWAY